MNRSRSWLAMPAACLAVAGSVVGIVVMVHSGAPPVQHPLPNPTGIPSNSRTDGPVQARDVTVPVYFLGDTTSGARLFREFRTYQGVVGWSDLRVAVTGAVLGDSTDPDYRSAFPKDTTARVSQEGDVVNVDLHSTRDLTTGSDGAMGVQSIVYTVDAVLQRAAPVRFMIDGSAARTVLGVDTSRLVERTSAEAVQAPVWVTDPGNQASVGSPFKVTGIAATFEANVVWELKDGGHVVRHGFTTAQQCCTPSPYSFTVQAPPGTYTLVVHDVDVSGTGRPVNSDTRVITVR
ncbi:MAG: hypothetical protein M3Y66_05370 [Actinomycetota bacterium]|nr:hypothetical protein [Actinomycetota bacterium]